MFVRQEHDAAPKGEVAVDMNNCFKSATQCSEAAPWVIPHSRIYLGKNTVVVREALPHCAGHVPKGFWQAAPDDMRLTPMGGHKPLARAW